MATTTVLERIHQTRLLFVIVDFFVILLSLLCAFYVRFEWGIFSELLEEYEISFDEYAAFFVLGTLSYAFTLTYFHTYEKNDFLNLRSTFPRLIKASIAWLFLFTSLSFAFSISPPLSRSFLIISFVISFLSLLAWRMIITHSLLKTWIAHRIRQNIIILAWQKHLKSPITW